ncbi:ribose 1,5-bisphosphate isomerase [Methanocella sp. CWC-04]|uniref:Thiamine thiazole synthase n=1 Tax=Methanooceanicella nereidis TaxID=2052831 RepID=A0AAP2RFN8_9EURY|nr:ribose 1,5-bisphosphate isomerase [Methanocella sp. CWC-04]
MELSEVTISKAIIDDFSKTFLDYTEIDAGIVGAGPSGLVCAAYLARSGAKVAVFERKLSVGGGMWGGGMMYPRIVVQKEALRILDDFNIRYREYVPGYYLANSIEAVGKLAAAAVDSGAEIFNLMSVEDVMIRQDDTITGLVINWTAVEMAGLHVDPLSISSKVVIDATGHDADVCRIVQRKVSAERLNEGRGVVGEKSMWADVGEKVLLSTTKEVYPGLIVAGMAANAVSGGHRMGPIFGGMLLSGELAAKKAKEYLKL